MPIAKDSVVSRFQRLIVFIRLENSPSKKSDEDSKSNCDGIEPRQHGGGNERTALPFSSVLF